MKKFMLTILLIAFCFTVSQADVVISSGEKSKSFSQMTDRVTQIINRKDITNLNSKGSLDNIDNLISNKAQVGLAFADSFMYKKASDPRADKLKIIGTLGKGCLYTVAKKDGKVSDSGDLETDKIVIDPGKPGAGANTTWTYLGDLDSDFKKPIVKNIGGNMGLSAIISGQTDAMLQMQHPSVNNALVKDVLNDKSLKFVPMKNWSFNSKLPNGQAVYTKENIPLETGFMAKTLDTICTDTLVLANENVSEDDLELISGIVLRNQKAILGEK